MKKTFNFFQLYFREINYFRRYIRLLDVIYHFPVDFFSYYQYSILYFLKYNTKKGYVNRE